jgi:hypothetical protein
MRMFGRSRATGKRLVPRTEAPVLAVLSTSAGNHRAAIIDISRTGVRLGGEHLPAVGEQLTFRADDVRAVGDVVWSEGSCCAVEFATPIAAGEVNRLRIIGSIRLAP